MKLSTYFDVRVGGLAEVVRLVELERAGLHMVWIPESYGFDAFTRAGFIAARTERLCIGTGIVNVYSRSAAVLAMTAAGCDELSGGRFALGLGASGPQVIEGFHGVPYDKPLQRMKEYTDLCRQVWRRELLALDGVTVQIPLGAQNGAGLGKSLRLLDKPVRPAIPIWWASIKGRSVAATAEVADGWLPALYLPEKASMVWGPDLEAGLTKRPAHLGPLEICAGGDLAIGEHFVRDEQRKMLEPARAHIALYVGGMGAVGKNFYNDICSAYGYEQEAQQIQELFLSGRKEEAAARVPDEWVLNSNLVGPAGFVAERVAAYREAGVTMLNVNPVGPDPVGQFELFAARVT